MREEEEALRREEEEAAKRAREADEKNRQAKEAEEARRLKEEEEKAIKIKEAEEARQLAEVEEAARRTREEKLEAEQKAVEQQKKTGLHQPTVKPSGQPPERDETVVPETRAKTPVKIEDTGRAHVQVSKEQRDSEKINWVNKAGPQSEVQKNQRTNESESSPHSGEEGAQAKPPEPQTDPRQTRAPPLSKLPVSRSQEKRELRRQRGLEHNQRESQRAASVGNDDPSFKSKTLESPSKAEGKLKERADSKELDQYTFVAWKVDKVKRDELVRPSTLPLDIPASGTEKNSYGDPGIINSKAAPVKEDANKRKEPSRSNTQPENLITAPRSLEDKNIKLLQYDLFCTVEVIIIHNLLQNCMSITQSIVRQLND